MYYDNLNRQKVIYFRIEKLHNIVLFKRAFGNIPDLKIDVVRHQSRSQLIPPNPINNVYIQIDYLFVHVHKS